MRPSRGCWRVDGGRDTLLAEVAQELGVAAHRQLLEHYERVARVLAIAVRAGLQRVDLVSLPEEWARQ